MSASWSMMPLGHVAQVKSGFAFKSSRWVSSGIPVVKIANVKRGRVDMTAAVSFVSEEDAGLASRYRLRRGDILVGMTGYVGEVARVATDDHLLLNQRVGRVKPLPGALIRPDYLYFALFSPTFRAQAVGLGSGSAQANVSPSQLEGIEIPVPPPEEQERIAGVLGAFDDLIETNRRLASGLEILARAVSSRPRGRVPLVDVADIPRLVQRRPEGLVDHYSIPAYDNGYLASRESSETILSGKQMLVTDSVLISRLNPTTERTWMVYPDEQVSAVCSPEFAVVRGTEALPSEVLWAFASRPDFWDQMRGSVGGTTNSRQRVDKAAIPAFEVPDPSELSAQETAAIRTSVRAATELRREAASLSGQRDELLPLLMSGRVRVRDVEAAVS